MWKSLMIESQGYLIVVLDFPDFVDQLDYQIQGNIICNQGDKVVDLSLPYFKISIHDATDRILVGIFQTFNFFNVCGLF